MRIRGSNSWFLWKGFFLVLSLIISKFLFSLPKELEITDNSFFEIVGSDVRSTQFANKLSNYVAESILRNFAQEDYIPTRKILVQLLNKDTFFNTGEHYSLSTSKLGFATLNLAWNESLSMQKFIEALVFSFVNSFGYSNHGSMFIDECPSKAWLLKGLSQDIYLSLRPRASRLFYQEAIHDGFDQNHLNAKLSDNSVPTDAQSFAIFRFINSDYVSREDRLKLLNQGLLGVDISQLVLSAFCFENFKSFSSVLSLFLSNQLDNYSAEFKSLASSKKWLETLGDFSSIEIESKKSKDNSLHLLWLSRADPMIIQFIEARIILISLALNEINPLYYNAAISLGLTYQKILDGVEEWELLYYYSDFLHELDKANTVSVEIDRQLKLEGP